MRDSITVSAGGCSLALGAPVQVGRATGHFWFPTLHRAGSGLFCEVVVAPDQAQGKWPARLFWSGTGREWQPAADLDSYGPASVLLPSGQTLLMPYELWPLEPGERRNAGADGTLLTLRSSGCADSEPAPIRFLGVPGDLADYHEGELNLVTNGNVLPLRDGSLFTTLYGTLAGEPQYTCFAMTSTDGGFTWQYRSVVARWQDVPDAPEGPCESNTVRLADGRLLCVYRVGSGRDYPYHASLSGDDGLSWSRPAPLPGAWSVEPQLARLGSKILLLSGGRHGLFLWVNTAGDGASWVPVNLAEHHNALCPDPSLRFSDAFCRAETADGPAESTSYTGLLAISPDEALLCYDRLGNGWAGAPGPNGDADVVFCVRVTAA